MLKEKNRPTEKNTIAQKPIIAIVGRPNVGKSTLFNRIIEWRKAIVEDIPGVTRDRIYEDTEWKGNQFVIIDTGGLETRPDDTNQSLIKDQVEIAIEEADLIIFLTDANDGPMPQDFEIANYLRKTEKTVINAINKIDHDNHDSRALDFHSLGIEEYIGISALHNRNIYELLELLVSHFKKQENIIEDDDSDYVKIAFVGKPNVGKSTLVNNILGEQRLITSPIPGTTRDSIDTSYINDRGKYKLIDTAGIRRKSKISFLVERHSVIRAIRTIERSDIVLLIIDSELGPTHHDSRLAQLIKTRNKGSIVLLNKWDLAPKEIAELDHIEEITKERLKAIDYAPVLTISGLTGKRVNRIFDKIDSVYKNYTTKIPTGELNRFLEQVKKAYPNPVYKGKEVKLFYISQPFVKPPTFIIFTNSSKGIPENYRRYVEKRLRDSYGFEGVPIKLKFRDREGQDV